MDIRLSEQFPIDRKRCLLSNNLKLPSRCILVSKDNKIYPNINSMKKSDNIWLGTNHKKHKKFMKYRMVKFSWEVLKGGIKLTDIMEIYIT